MFGGTLYIDIMAGFVGTCIRYLTLLQGSRSGNTELDWEKRLLATGISWQLGRIRLMDIR